MGFSNLSIRNRIMSIALAAATVTMLLPSNLLAQEKLQKGGGSATMSDGTKPVVVVTIGSISKLMQDVNYVTSIAGQPQAGGLFQVMAGTVTQGIDTSQPIGILVPMVDGLPEPIAVIPTPNVKTVLKRLEAQTGPVDELDDGTLVIAVGANTVYIRQSGDWAVAARTRDVLALAPADPTALFTGMGNAYDLAFRVKMQQIPEDTRNMLIGQMRQGFEQAMAQNPAGSPEMAENTIEQMERMINESDEINFGINIDEANKQIAINFAYAALAGTELADIYNGQKSIPSKFASVINPAAAAYFHSAASVSPAAVELTTKSLESTFEAIRGALTTEGLPADQAEEINEMIDRVGDLYIKSIAEGKMDMGAQLIANEQNFKIMLGGFVSDGNEAAQIAKDLAAKVDEAAAGKENAPRFKFDQGTYNGVTMHVIEADVPESEDEARRIFGEVLRIHIGTGPKSLYVAAGKESESMLKKFIDAGANDAGATDRPVGQMRFTLLPILKFAQTIDDNEVISTMINSLESAPDPGEVQIVSEVIPNGTDVKIAIGEGLIKAIGEAVTAAQGNPPGQF